ncbi:P-loop containing nucleoside triphosphate hydrolase protein [Cylindrobasidium torrendii FP15055 ss-10]|uniref:p-loop containing nucleoside triphosphate hydrolase protein n=1 Tax=Cylindrobasidium torrendii FP15055 ss-10 TaxID=1314674 RepID=A0A0D7BRI5_9AGAR|nr:P-loop containing nucleoside triphosphate hydrolase protein [Cylindrobasidium torrendii FP15055 ss-10]
MIVFASAGHGAANSSVWIDSKTIPLYASAVSLAYYLAQILLRTVSTSPKAEQCRPILRSTAVTAFLVARVLCAAIVVVVFASALDSVKAIWMVLAPIYLLGLSIASMRSRTPARAHAVFIFAIFAGAYAYRDIYPLATFNQHPIDVFNGWRIPVLLVALMLGGVVVPLFQPSEYQPVDEEDDTRVLNAEQQASLASKLTYQYLDSFVFSSLKLDTLPEKIPSLPYAYSARYFKKQMLPIIDPFVGTFKDRHVFWSLCLAYKRELWILFPLELLKSLVVFVGPIGVNRLVAYLDNGGEGAIYKPWVWIVWLLLGPLIQAIITQSFTHIACRVMVTLEAILTQLLYNHTLRIRSHHEGAENESKAKGSSTMAGKINTLATADMQNIKGVSTYWVTAAFLPFQILLCVAFLYFLLDWSVFVGFGILVLGTPLVGKLTGMMQTVQRSVMQKTTARVAQVTEVMSVLRMVKFFGWEPKVRDEINKKRDDELRALRKSKFITLHVNNVNFYLPITAMLATYATFTLIMHRRLSASVIFSSLSVFEMMRKYVRSAVMSIGVLVKARVSLDRLDDFVRNTELLDESTRTNSCAVAQELRQETGIKDSEFQWFESPSRPFKLTIEGTLSFTKGVNLIVGPTGSGKTSLLMALLGEMYHLPSGPDSWYNVYRGNGVSYAAQESWVLNETIRDNILFGEPFDEERYRKVIHQCALEQDLELFGAGDLTEVGEKGLSLSGGQQARVTLARAVYSKALVVLLDDVLAALDVHTSKWIVRRCLQGDLLSDRIVLLTTHNVAMTKPLASMVVAIDQTGKVSWGSAEDMLPDAERSVDDSEESQDVPSSDASTSPAKEAASHPADGRLIVAEEVSEGRVSRTVFGLYTKNLSRFTYLFWLLFLGSALVLEGLLAYLNWYLGHWASLYKSHENVNARHYLGWYTVLVLMVSVCFSSMTLLWTFGSLRSARIIHQKLIESVTSTTLRWLDRTPVSRVIARTTVDIAVVDNEISNQLFRISEISMEQIVKLGAVLYFSPSFSFPALFLVCVGLLFGQVYLRAQLPVKRITSNAKSPVIGLFGAAVSGAVSIRAYGAQGFFADELMSRLDRWTRPSLTFFILNRWICIRTEFVSGVFTASLALYLVYGHGHSASASDAGFSIMTGMMFTNSILTWLRQFNAIEIEESSLERITHYIDAEKESKATAGGVPPAYWPSSGTLRIENLSAKYTENGPEVLHSLNFEVRSGERVGIVGRTGSGKSSLTLALLRCIPTTGDVYYDGLKTSAINLEDLRAKVTIIPQVPELLSGTLRHNLDPFSQYDDATLNDALRASGLYSLQDEEGETGINLDTIVASGGGNFSVGQRQILALARALVRSSKLMILDEAMSSIDYKTDAVIQKSLRTELRDVTLLTVAHRLHTVMDFDRIMVLDQGNIVEFDTPKALLTRDDGYLRRLVDESSDRPTLYSMAGTGV